MQDRKRDTDVKNRLLGSVGEGKGGMIWENSIETCILPYAKQMTSASSCIELGEGRGRRSLWGDTYAPTVDSCLCMAKTTTIL